nr:basic helix-loop-helix transcription factor [Loropetalum chinense var. rubrum]WIE96049.1 basic helix-loop-helix transcription factor [Loropetalum chinense var. rubrum]
MTSPLSNLPSMCDHGFVELVWENDEIVMRGVSNTTPKSPSFMSLNTKSARYESPLQDSTLLDHKQKAYLHHPHPDSLQDAYHPHQLLPPESYEPNLNMLTKHINHHNQFIDSSHDNSNFKQASTSQQYESCSMQQCHASAPFIRSQDFDFISTNDCSHQQDPGPDMKMGLLNFSHFLRPAALVKTSIQSFGATRPTNKTSAADADNKTSVELSAGGSKIITGFQDQQVPMTTEVELISSTSKEPFHDKNFVAVCEEDASKKNGSLHQVLGQPLGFAASAAEGKPDTKKSIKPPVASSSICSHGASNDPTYYLKRKYYDTEDSAYPSASDEEEPEGTAKAARARGRSGAKRGRTAEVHNLSERKQRDRINKKIRALQELIPNCNKVDKASMLDEAIEYMKTLQLQVQIMSMGSGVFMPRVMVPTGMQQIQVPHLTHFSPMGFGMGMGVGCSPLQFPTSPISGPTALPGFRGTGLQMLGLSSQVLPFIPLPGGPSSTQSLPLHDASAGAASIVNANVECSRNQTSCQATKNGPKHSARSGTKK